MLNEALLLINLMIVQGDALRPASDSEVGDILCEITDDDETVVIGRRGVYDLSDYCGPRAEWMEHRVRHLEYLESLEKIWEGARR